MSLSHLMNYILHSHVIALFGCMSILNCHESQDLINYEIPRMTVMPLPRLEIFYPRDFNETGLIAIYIHHVEQILTAPSQTNPLINPTLSEYRKCAQRSALYSGPKKAQTQNSIFKNLRFKKRLRENLVFSYQLRCSEVWSPISVAN